VEDDRIAQWWQQPVVGLTSADAIEASVGWIKCAGEVFYIADDASLMGMAFPQAGRTIRPLILAGPGSMRHVLSGSTLAGWVYKDAAGNEHKLIPEQVIHVKFWNPYNPWRGLGELEAASLAVESDYHGARYNRNLALNSGDQGSYIVAKNGIPTDEQRQQIVRELKVKKDRAMRGEYKPIFLSGDIEIQDPKVQMPDASFWQGRLMNRHEIFIAFGVPASMADVQASYSIGSASDRYILIEDTCMPLSSKLSNALSPYVAAQLGNAGLTLCFNWDEHSIMQSVRRERIDSAVKLWGMGMPLREVSEYLDMDLPEVDGDEVGYLPFSVQPVATATEPVQPQTDSTFSETVVEEEETDEDDVSDVSQELAAVAAGLRSRKESKPQMGPDGHRSDCQCGFDGNDIDERVGDAEGVRLWRRQMRQRMESVRTYESKFRRETFKARATVLKKLESVRADRNVRAPSDEVRASVTQFMFSLDEFRKGVLGAMKEAAALAFDAAGKQLYGEIEKTDPWKTPPKALAEFMGSRENRLSGATDAIFERVKGALNEGFDAGDSIKGIADRVRAEFNGIDRERAKTIAMTETAAAYGYARHEAMVEAGITYKAWVTSGNSNVRTSHRMAGRDYSDGIPLNMPFRVGGFDLMFPGDPSGPPQEVINCHCVQIAVKAPPSTEEET
jgi:hypothetical protein